MGEFKSSSEKTRPNKIEFECDDLDYAVIQRAMSIRMRGVLPTHGSESAGALIAEICRGWLDHIGEDIIPKPEQ